MKYIIILLISISFFACNKEQRYSQKLIKGEVWHVTDLDVDDKNLDFTGRWIIVSDANIYDSVPTAFWKNTLQNVKFEWQFQDKGKKFQMNYLPLCCGNKLDSLDKMVYNLTGNYTVKRHSTNKMKFTSNNTIGYPGKKVVIELFKSIL